MDRWRYSGIRRTFWGIVLIGIFCVFHGLTGLGGGDFPERVASILLGVSVLAGFGGSLLLSYDEVSEKDRFTVQVIVRVGFMALAPTILLCGEAASHTSLFIDLKYIIRSVIFSSLTVVPFGISLLWLIWKKKRGDG